MKWVISPAYDLLNVSILLPEDEEELALTLEGKRKNLKKEHFIKLGKGLELTEKQVDRVFNRIIKTNLMQFTGLISPLCQTK